MNSASVKLHQTLIRLAKGMLGAWEEWVRTQLPPPRIEENPDPIKHFKNLR